MAFLMELDKLFRKPSLYYTKSLSIYGSHIIFFMLESCGYCAVFEISELPGLNDLGENKKSNTRRAKLKLQDLGMHLQQPTVDIIV